MAQKTYAIANFNQASYFKSWARNNWGSLTRGYTTPSNNTQTYSVVISELPAGSTINWATINFTDNLGLYGGTATPSSGAAVSATVGGTTTVSWYWKSSTGGSYPSYPTSNTGDSTNYSSEKTGLRQLTGIYVLVDYTPPTAAGVSGVALAGSTSTQYAAAGGGLALTWNAWNGTNNVITAYNVQYADNDGAWGVEADGWHRTVYASGTAGTRRRWRVYANAPYGSNDWQYSPYVYTRSNPTPPSTVSVNPTSVYTGENVTVSWNAGGAGTGVAISKYELYCNDIKVGETTALSLTVATPSTAGNAVYKVKTIGNVSGYNSALSSASATVTVENPRSTGTLDKSSVPMDGTSTMLLTVIPSNAAYSHKVIWYTTAARKATDKAEQTLAVGITSATLNPVPLDWCNAYTGRPPYTANCTLETYNGAVKIGELNYTFGVTVPTDIKPTVSLAVEPVDGLGGLYVRTKSKAKLTATASGAYSSTIESYAMTGNGKSGATNPWTTPDTYSAAGTHDVSVIVTDTRGRTATALVTITVTAYNTPVIDPITAERCTDNGTLNNDGTYIKLTAGLSVSSVGGNNAIVTSVAKYRDAGGSTWVNGDAAFDGEAILGTGNFAITNAYEIEITITDTVGNTSTHRLTVLASDRLFDFRTDRASIGRIAGTVAKTFILPDDWTTNIKLGNIDGEGKVGTVADLLLGTGAGGAVEAKTVAQLKALMLDINHPVGTIYQSAVSTSPATLFGGTWAAIAAGTFLVAAGTGYSAGATGGEATHTLTTAEMPAHNHSIWSLNWEVATGPAGAMAVATAYGAKGATSGNAGDGVAHNNLPPYLAVYMWERTA